MSENREKKFITLVGRVGNDPTTRETRVGDVMSFSLFVRTGYSDEHRDRMFSISIWNEGLQEWAKSEVYKGATVALEGFMEIQERDGKTYYQVSVVDLYLTEKGKRTKRQDKPAPAPAPKPAAEEEFPF